MPALGMYFFRKGYTPIGPIHKHVEGVDLSGMIFPKI
jgi:hypothetical protein